MTTRKGRANIMKNGETLLRELITSFNGKRNPIRAFSSKELKTATSNYDTGNVIIDDFAYRLYKGSLKDGPISVMKFKDKKDDISIEGANEEDISIVGANEESINCIVFASQMGHKNILKLIGCCLETQTPILVFESAEYGTLTDRVNRPLEPHFKPLLLTHRLKIAMEMANAFAYLHVGFSRPIVFRNCKPSNVVFHDQYVAKLFDFSFSASIPEGETHIQPHRIVGRYRYMAPEYRSRGIFNEKSDVYSFGAILPELLTGEKLQHLYETALNDFDDLADFDASNPPTPTPMIYETALNDFDDLADFDASNPPTPPPMIYETALNDFDDLADFDASNPPTPPPMIDYRNHYRSQEVLKKHIDDQLSKMIDPVNLGEEPYSGKDIQLQALPELILKCVSGSAEERPTIIDVAKQLRKMYGLP